MIGDSLSFFAYTTAFKCTFILKKVPFPILELPRFSGYASYAPGQKVLPDVNVISNPFLIITNPIFCWPSHFENSMKCQPISKEKKGFTILLTFSSKIIAKKKRAESVIGYLILSFLSLFRRYFQGIPENNPSQRHIYSTSDKWGGTQGPPKCITCDLKKEAENCTFNDAIFSPS